MFLRLLRKDIFSKNDFYDRDKDIGSLINPTSYYGRMISKFIAFLVYLSVAIIILETISGLETQYGYYFFQLDIFISMVFAWEYLYRFFHSENKLKFTSNIFNIIDLLSFLPFFLGLLLQITGGFDIWKILRLLRTFRLIGVSSHSPLVLGFLHTIKEYRFEYKAILSIFMSILVIVCTFVYYAETNINPLFSSIPQTLWWGIVTMTTVGYGDMVPLTISGKLLGVFLILLGPVLMALIGSITILVFMDVAEKQKHMHVIFCTKCHHQNPSGSNYCNECGHREFEEISPHTEKKSLVQKLFGK